MTSVCDVILRVSFNGVISPSVCSRGLARPNEIVLQKVIFSCVRAIFFFF